MGAAFRLNAFVNMSNTYTKRSYIAFFAFLTLMLVIVDQFLKRIITFNFKLAEQKEIISGFFSINYVVNKGSAFSFLADKPWGIYVLSGISFVVGIFVLIFMVSAATRGFKLIATSLCLIAAGAFGNLVDRFTLHYVVDFLRFDFGSYTFPIFNFADICAVVGTLMFIIVLIFDQKTIDDFLSIVHKGAGEHA